MNHQFEIETLRLGLRRWKEEDKLPFSEMNGNDEVMRYFASKLTREESDGFVERIRKHFEEYGYGLWAVELKETAEFMGFIGFYTATFEADFTPCLEIGWRLSQKFWNQGYATEGAKACLKYGFETLGLAEVYSFTSLINEPSIHVMNKIGLRDTGRFMHPRIKDGSPLKEHVLYHMDRRQYEEMVR